MYNIKVLIFTNENEKGLLRLLGSMPSFLLKSSHIFDDNSKYKLDSSLAKVIHQNSSNLGLFANMSMAIRTYVDPDDFVLILQDDVQFVCEVSQEMMDEYCHFMVSKRLDELDLRFMRSTGYSRYLPKNVVYDYDSYINRDYPYTDIGLWRGSSLHTLLLPVIDSIAQTHFKSTSLEWGKEVWIGKKLVGSFRSRLHKNPIIAHTPFPDYRYSSPMTWLYGALSSIMPKEFMPLTIHEYQKFEKRPLTILPIDFLFLKTKPNSSLFFFPVQPGLRNFKSLIKHP